MVNLVLVFIVFTSKNIFIFDKLVRNVFNFECFIQRVKAALVQVARSRKGGVPAELNASTY